ncbi:unnamed protein product [Ilex paraguariensis]|uniref:Uncharacterized protein n=1 Tax=Ilex paraguariensis TaxID=185542 RepID=A0ABC8RUZ9_9AQUA
MYKGSIPSSSILLLILGFLPTNVNHIGDQSESCQGREGESYSGSRSRRLRPKSTSTANDEVIDFDALSNIRATEAEEEEK